MKRIIDLLVAVLFLIAVMLYLTGCLTVGGHIGYQDPETGLNAGITIGSAPDHKAVKLPSKKGLQK